MKKSSLPKGMIVCENCGLIAVEKKSVEGKSVCITCQKVELDEIENYPMLNQVFVRVVELMTHQQKVELYETFNVATYSDDNFNEWISEL
tara:strand:- start:247 stop:516 length:270 start_codon:yes stop_codon:yes gene_type:complete